MGYTMKASEIYRNNACGLKEYERDGMIFPFWVGVFDGMVIDSDDHIFTHMTEEDFCAKYNFEFDYVANRYENAVQFFSDWSTLGI